MLRIADIRNRHYAHDRDTCSIGGFSGLKPRPWRGHGYGLLNEEVSQRISQRSPCVTGGDRTCWKFTLWNLSEIYLLDIYVKLAENLPSSSCWKHAFWNLPKSALQDQEKVIHEEVFHCRHSTSKLPRQECWVPDVTSSHALEESTDKTLCTAAAGHWQN